MAHHWWVLIAGGWQTLRSADGGCWHSSLYFLLPSDDGSRVSSESTAQLGGNLHKAESERGQREADPIVLHSAQVPGVVLLLEQQIPGTAGAYLFLRPSLW